LWPALLKAGRAFLFRSSGVQEFRSSGVQEFRSSGVKEFRSSGVQEFRSSGVQEFRSSGVQEFRSSGDAGDGTLQKSKTECFGCCRRTRFLITDPISCGRRPDSELPNSCNF
jgi:hypothetical protein